MDILDDMGVSKLSAKDKKVNYSFKAATFFLVYVWERNRRRMFPSKC